MQEQLDAGKKVSFIPRGNSMLPMLHGGEDMVILEKPKADRLHLFDVALYYRRETDAYVIHRLVNFQNDGAYVMLGDNNFQREYNILPEDIIGVVTAFYRKGKMYTVSNPLYRIYVNLWYYIRPLRLLLLRVKSKTKQEK